MTHSPRERWAWWGLLTAFLIYGALFIARTSFVVEGVRYFCLFDDAMISMRYARMLVAGEGLVWNPGERIEGITNLGWTLVMAALQVVLPLPRMWAALPVQLLSLCVLLANLFVVRALARRIMPGPQMWPVRWLALALVAFYHPGVSWALLGMETGVLTLALYGAIACGLRAVERPASGAKYLWSAALILALATVVRMDALPIGAVLLVLTAACLQAPRRDKVYLAIGTVSLVIFAVLAQTGFRMMYYGESLPNTYYLKMTGFPPLYRMTRGAAHWGYAMVFVAGFPLALVTLLLAVQWFRRRVSVPRVAPWLRELWADRSRALAVVACVGIAAVQSAYSVYVGGDAWERVAGANRYLAPAMPAILLLLMAAVSGALLGAIPIREHRAAVRMVLPVIAVLWWYALHLHAPARSLWRAMLIEPPYSVADNRRNVELVKWVERNAPPNAVIALDWAGTMPYFMDNKFLDLLGKSDYHVARVPMKRGYMDTSKWLEFYPGHLKWDYGYTIGFLRPDVVISVWGRSWDNAGDYLQNFTETKFGPASVYVRARSSKATDN